VKQRRKHFNPRSPRGERLNSRHISDVLNGFQSALPSRGATAKRHKNIFYFCTICTKTRELPQPKANFTTHCSVKHHNYQHFSGAKRTGNQ
jgi:hypothetical protein